MLNDKKLLLVLDLDHTLLNSTRFEEVSGATSSGSCHGRGNMCCIDWVWGGQVEAGHEKRLAELLERQEQESAAPCKGADTVERAPNGAAFGLDEQPEAQGAEQGSQPAADAQQPSLYCLTHMGLWTKLRPFVRVCDPTCSHVCTPRTEREP